MAFAHGGVGEILQEVFPYGAVPVADYEAAARKIIHVLKNRFNVRKHNFTLDKMCDNTISMYEELV